jgi:hypothetical protein
MVSEKVISMYSVFTVPLRDQSYFVLYLHDRSQRVNMSRMVVCGIELETNSSLICQSMEVCCWR